MPLSTGNKIWRLIFNLLLMAMLAFVSWVAVEALLDWAATNPQLASTPFGAGKDPGWLGIVYHTAFLSAGLIFGFALGAALFRRIEILGDRFAAMSIREKLSLGSGLLVGLVLTAVISIPIILVLSRSPLVAVGICLILAVTIIYLTTAAAMSMKEEIRFFMPPTGEEKVMPERFKLLDTNVIIDGRMADVARAGFIEGPIYVPGFVLDELQHIADSGDSLRRARGRRGLEVLNAMDKDLHLIVREYDRLAPPVAHEEVDARLVRLAKALNGSIVTNDFNLNRVATLQGVPVLNVNELANALKPVVLPGEEMRVTLVKEGKEPSQGVGYLDDGTMIVVENGRRHLGESVDVLVSSVLQTQAGKMIFAHLREDEGESDEADRGVRPYTRSGPRRPVRR
jgi:uncharacterized protein YacL